MEELGGVAPHLRWTASTLLYSTLLYSTLLYSTLLYCPAPPLDRLWLVAAASDELRVLLDGARLLRRQQVQRQLLPVVHTRQQPQG
jgi:hypothetical protein